MRELVITSSVFSDDQKIQYATLNKPGCSVMQRFYKSLLCRLDCHALLVITTLSTSPPPSTYRLCTTEYWITVAVFLLTLVAQVSGTVQCIDQYARGLIASPLPYVYLFLQCYIIIISFFFSPLCQQFLLPQLFLFYSHM